MSGREKYDMIYIDTRQQEQGSKKKKKRVSEVRCVGVWLGGVDEPDFVVQQSHPSAQELTGHQRDSDVKNETLGTE